MGSERSADVSEWRVGADQERSVQAGMGAAVGSMRDTTRTAAAWSRQQSRKRQTEAKHPHRHY